MSIFHIWPEEPRRKDGSLEVAATLEAPGRERQRLWYSIPEDRAGDLPDSCDLFTVGLIFLMMQAGVDVEVHGKVSPSLLRNLTEYQAVWAEWLPFLHNVEIRADQEEEWAPSDPREDAILSFSGGVDSCFTAYRNVPKSGLRNRRLSTAAIMVHGFDIPLDEPETYASALKRSENMTSSLGLDLIPIATNHRLLVEDWSHSFGPAIASCLMLFSGRFKAGLIAQGLTYGELGLLYEGSNPLTDPMLSSDSFRVIPDGGAYHRADKISEMQDWSEFLQHLRVCWAGPQKDRNCCVCEKCICNILTFRALGLGLPPCFDHDVSIQQINGMGLGNKPLAILRFGGLEKLAAEHGSGGEWVRVLGKRLAPLNWFQKSRIVRYLKHPRHYAGRAWQILTRKS
ncbi:MAG: hypothetical protein ACC655_00765 [Rhodothermia bacterium]